MKIPKNLIARELELLDWTVEGQLRVHGVQQHRSGHLQSLANQLTFKSGNQFGRNEVKFLRMDWNRFERLLRLRLLWLVWQLLLLRLLLRNWPLLLLRWLLLADNRQLLRHVRVVSRHDDPVTRELNGLGSDGDEVKLDGELEDGLEADDRVEDGRVRKRAR